MGARHRVCGVIVASAVASAVALLPATASGATRCAPPQGTGPGAWERAEPAEAGMDGARLQAALDYGTANLGFALRVYRRGCLVGADRLAAANQGQRYESWSMAKSVSAILFARAMTLGLISPGDPVGSLVGRASQAHGRITAHDLLTMTSGLRWNGWRDYNIFTMPDRVRDALTLELVHEPGAYYEYSQSGVSLLVEAIRRASGEDPVDFIQRRVFDRIGIPRSAWSWKRDREGQVLGFMGVEMRPDDFGRLGELMRRGGQWRGQRILSPRVVRRALAPSPANGCYGWLIWVNRSGPCIGPTITDRPESAARQFPGLPPDMYRFSGLFGQLVTVFPSQDLVVVRTGQDTLFNFTGGEGWERELYVRVLRSITDEPVEVTDQPPAQGDDPPNADYGFQTALLEPDQYSRGFVQDPWPPAGPARARGMIVPNQVARVRRGGSVRVRVACPRYWAGAPRLRQCRGRARLMGARRAVRYRVRANRTTWLRFKLWPRTQRRVKRAGQLSRQIRTRNFDGRGGARNADPVALRRSR
jgi:CubicO group peptidase (beta-lactamase class C family)